MTDDTSDQRFGLFGANHAPLHRRSVLKGGLLAGAGLLAGSFPRPALAQQGGEVVIRTAGGIYEDAWRKGAWDPFTAATGIKVVPVATNAAKVMAMIDSGNIAIDVLDFGVLQMHILGPKGVLEPFPKASLTLTDPADLIGDVHEFYVEHMVYSSVLAYNTERFADKHPKSWAEFWNATAFPGKRTLVDMGEGYVNLEFALLADGVPMDKLYPLDVERAFKKLGEIRPHIVKWWDSAAIASQLLAERQAVLASNYNSRVNLLISQKVPIAIEWNEAQRQTQTLCVMKGAKNKANAFKLIDYCLQPKVQAAVMSVLGNGPVNRKAFDFMDAKIAETLPTTKEHLAVSFAMDGKWWADNLKNVSERWQEFLLTR